VPRDRAALRSFETLDPGVREGRENHLSRESCETLHDVLVFDESSGLLQVVSSLPLERATYVGLFYSCILRQPDLAEQARSAQIYGLSPTRDDKFDYKGNEHIQAVALTYIHARSKMAWAL
jgi:hypothetical protein